MGNVPVACITIYSIGAVTGVRLQEDNCNVLILGSGARAGRVEII